MTFCDSLIIYKRAFTTSVKVGGVTIGGGEQVVVQSMTNTDTMDTSACVEQTLSIARQGADIVRLTTPSLREARNMKNIVEGVRQSVGSSVGIVADVHFSPEVALEAALWVDKVRINPGNFKQSGDEFIRLVELCGQRGVSLRIGVNHGSLGERIVERYGDTAQGMVASAMEFLEECRRLDFDQVVVSMKSSNVRVMVHAYRLLAAGMRERQMYHPLHLGVTEAGDAMQGRVKSAVGIGALMADGLGDTIRVSLSEAPQREIPVASLLVNHFQGMESHDAIENITDVSLYHPFEYSPRTTTPSGRVGGDGVPLLYSELNGDELRAIEVGRIVILESSGKNPAAEWRARILNMQAAGDSRPVILHRRYEEPSMETLQVKAAADCGLLFLDGLANGLWICNEGIECDQIDMLCFHILQAARARITQTEYIACPGCGRTQYDLEGTLAAIRARTSHLKGLKIGVMGCIVNGPGEMADADYGYVGSGPGRVTLYRGREVVCRNIPQDQAIDSLLDLINKG